MALVNFAGIASGIDSSALIDAMLDAQRQVRVTPNEKKVTELEDTNSAIDELKEKLETLKSAIFKFATLSGGGVSKMATSSDETKVTATAANGANDGAYKLTVTQLAKNGTKSSDQTFASATTAVSANTGTVTVEVGTGSNKETVDVSVTANVTTATQFVTEFNSESTTAYASLVNVGTASSPSYRIVITSNEQGTEKGTLAVTGLADFTFNNAAQTDQAQDAEFNIAGIGDFTRATNTISDVISGVTFNLQAPTASQVTVSITSDTTTSTSNAQAFIDAYNDVVKYIAENNLITRQEDGDQVTNIFAPLASTRVDDNALSALRADISSTSYTGSEIKIFADLGITTERDGTLKFDSDTFQSAISKEPHSVDGILSTFADETSLTGGTIDNFLRFNGIFDSAKQSNTTQIESLNKRIAEAEAAIEREKQNLQARFARLESLMGRLQSQQSALTSALAGLAK